VIFIPSPIVIHYLFKNFIGLASEIKVKDFLTTPVYYYAYKNK